MLLEWSLKLLRARRWAGTSSVARGYSGYVDQLMGNPMRDYFREHLAMDMPFLASFPDLFALGLVLTLTGSYSAVRSPSYDLTEIPGASINSSIDPRHKWLNSSLFFSFKMEFLPLSFFFFFFCFVLNLTLINELFPGDRLKNLKLTILSKECSTIGGNCAESILHLKDWRMNWSAFDFVHFFFRLCVCNDRGWIQSKKCHMFLLALLTFGVRESTRFNNVFTVCNLAIVTYVIICGCFRSIKPQLTLNQRSVNLNSYKNWSVNSTLLKL